MNELPNFQKIAEHYDGLAIEFRRLENMDSVQTNDTLRIHSNDIGELRKAVLAGEHNARARIRNAQVTTDAGLLSSLVNIKTNEAIQEFPATLGALLGLADQPLFICLKALGVEIPPEYDPDSEVGGPVNDNVLKGYRRDLAKHVGVLRRETVVVEEF